MNVVVGILAVLFVSNIITGLTTQRMLKDFHKHDDDE